MINYGIQQDPIGCNSLQRNINKIIEDPHTNLKNTEIQKHHYNTGYIETPQRRVDDIVRIIEQALVRTPVRCIV